MKEGPDVLTGFSSLVRDMSMLSELPSLVSTAPFGTVDPRARTSNTD